MWSKFHFIRHCICIDLKQYILNSRNAENSIQFLYSVLLVFVPVCWLHLRKIVVSCSFICKKILSRESRKCKQHQGTIIYFLCHDRLLLNARTKLRKTRWNFPNDVQAPTGDRWNMANINNKVNNIRYDDMEQCTLCLVTILLFAALKAEENSLKSTVHGMHHRVSLFNKFKGYFGEYYRALLYCAFTLVQQSVQNLSRNILAWNSFDHIHAGYVVTCFW